MNQFLRYRLVKELGKGGMATVYLASDEVLNRFVAIKLVHPHLLDKPETVRRFTTEAHAVASVSHENIIKVFDFGDSGGKRYLVMEYVEGISLLDLLEKNRLLPNLVTIEILRQVLSGLIVVHEKNIIHRDIKPGNIMIDRHGCVRIMDFGIAFLVNQQSITMTGTFVGSPSHISPEQAEGKAITGKTDIFSLGTMCYECVTGTPAFAAENPQVTIHRVLNHQPEPPCRQNPQVLSQFSEIIQTCMSKDSATRPDAASALSLLDRFCKDEGLAIGRNRLTGFIANPAQYATMEHSEIFSHYRAKAIGEFKSKRVASGLKKLHQAKAFGVLDPDDDKYVKSIGKQKLFIKVLLVFSTVFLLFSISYGGWRLTGRYLHRFLNKPSVPAVLIPEKHGITAEIIRSDSNSFIDLPIADNTISEKRHLSNSKRQEKNTATGLPVRKSIRNVENTAKTEALVPSAAENTFSAAELKKPEPVKNKETGTQLGYLEINTSPPWVKVSIDGNQWGQTPKIQIVPLVPGTHVLELQKDGFEQYSERIDVQASDTLRKRIRLHQSLQ
jgi:serine/threonine protein kinase